MAKKAPKKAKAKTQKKTKKTLKKSASKKRPVAKKKPAKKTMKKTSRMSQRSSAVKTSAPQRLDVGQMAPNFTLPDQTGSLVSLSNFRGKNVVLYFYPKDDTPGCTKEACSFRDNLSTFEGINAVILGVSFDDQASHQKFIEKYGLNFTLLSDPSKETAQAYGVYVQKNMYGNISWGIERSTFVIDAEGKIAAAFRRVSVDGHTEQVLDVLQKLAA